MPNYLDRFKMASCPLKSDGFFYSKPDQNILYLCGVKNEREICHRMLDKKHREYEVSFSLLQIGSNSYNEVALRSL